MEYFIIIKVMIIKVIDENNTVPVFTPSLKFISQDTTHFTKAGAQYFAHLFAQDLDRIFAKIKH
jgi:hypothetical protein